MKFALPTTLITLGLLSVACGSSTSQSGQSPVSGKDADAVDATSSADGDDQEKSSKKKKSALKNRAERPETLTECSAVAAHENMEHCDADDLAVQQQQTALQEAEQSQGETTPPPEAPAPEPVATSTPAPTPPTETSTTPPAPPAPPKDPNIVEFRIRAGTGTQPWNTQNEMVVAKVGQTIRIINDDTVTHRLHTNGAPCPHGSNFGPGESMDCVVTRAFDGAARGPLYDHIVGESAAFYVTATP
jgi:hypothetical protein